MKKTMAIGAILAMATMAYGAADDWYIGAGYDGVSIKKDLTKEYTVQVSYGGFSDVAGFKGRVLYKFQNYRKYNLYGFGGLMYATDTVSSSTDAGYGTTLKTDADITTKGFEFGAGIEYDLQKGMRFEMPIFVSIEAGYRASSTDVSGKSSVSTQYDQYYTSTGSASYDYSGAFGGIWVHYRF